MTKDEAAVGSGGVLDGEDVSRCYITDIDSTAVLSADALSRSLHQSFHPASRGEVFFAQGRTHHETWADCHDLELLAIAHSRLHVPGFLLSKDLGLGVVAHTFGTIWVAPVAFVVGAVGRLVCLGWILN